MYGKIKDLILLFKIPKGKRNNFFEIYRQFVQAHKKVSPALNSAISLYLIVQLAVTSLTWSQEYDKSCRRSTILTHERSPLHSRTHPRDGASPFFNVYDLEEYMRERERTDRNVKCIYVD